MVPLCSPTPLHIPIYIHPYLQMFEVKNYSSCSSNAIVNESLQSQKYLLTTRTTTIEKTITTGTEQTKTKLTS